MGVWREAYDRLTPEQQERVFRWIHLNKFIANTLRIPWERWINEFIQPCMEHPLDYGFLSAVFPQFEGLDVEGQGASFSRGMDPSTQAVARVPLRAKNNLGRLSPASQDAISRLLVEGGEDRVRLSAADVAQLQKILPKEKALAKLKKPDFRRLYLARDGDDLLLALGEDGGGGEEIVRLNVLEASAIMGRPLL